MANFLGYETLEELILELILLFICIQICVQLNVWYRKLRQVTAISGAQHVHANTATFNG